MIHQCDSGGSESTHYERKLGQNFGGQDIFRGKEYGEIHDWDKEGIKGQRKHGSTDMGTKE